MREVETIVGLLAVVVVLVMLARRLDIPYPIPLVLGGLTLGFVPGLPRVSMPPELVLLVFLPPLLYSESLTLSWRDFRANLRPIGMLSIGLVAVTTVLVAATAHAVVPGLPWAAAFVLGAIVAPTDEVAVAAVAERLPIPRRLLLIIEAESLVNDAISLVLYRLAAVAVVSGAFSWVSGGGQFLLASVGGVGVGLLVGFGVGRLRRRLTPDPLVENTISLLTPFLAYLPAETLHVSGVLAVVATGLYLGRQGPRFITSATRLQAAGLWGMIDFLLNSLLFILLGLQLRPILGRLAGRPWTALVSEAALVSLCVVVTRIAWVFPAAILPRLLSRRLRASDPMPSWRQMAVVAWTGIRGGISLAAALALPLVTDRGAAFPQRDMLIFLTFAVILSTLVVQGLSLPVLIRRLGLKEDDGVGREEADARLRTSRAGLARLDRMAEAEDLPQEIVDDLRAHLTNRTRRLEARTLGDANEAYEARAGAYRRLRQEILRAERETVVGLRDGSAISDDVMRRLLRALDLEEQRLTLEEEDELEENELEEDEAEEDGLGEEGKAG